MLRTVQILVSAIALAACVLNLSACGQTGSLYLPPSSSAKPAAASTVNATTPSAGAAPANAQ